MAPISLLRLLLSVFFLLFRPAMAVLVNVTVDDAGQDSYTGAQIIYSPANAWSLGPLCKDCTAHPDPGSTFNGTWHDGFFDPATNTVLNASFQFEGTSQSSTLRVELFMFSIGSALYVNCITSNSSSNPAGFTDLVFFLDGHLVGIYTDPLKRNQTYAYNVLVYSNSSIPPGQHTFVMQNGQLQAPGSLALLDSITYTYVFTMLHSVQIYSYLPKTA